MLEPVIIKGGLPLKKYYTRFHTNFPSVFVVWCVVAPPLWTWSLGGFAPFIASFACCFFVIKFCGKPLTAILKGKKMLAAPMLAVEIVDR